MLEYKLEQEIHEQGYQYVCGVDEAGRGPLCGPVVAAACILPDGFVLEGLNDSKKLTPKKRDKLFDLIRENAIAYCIAEASVEEIDQLNILEADLLAMRRAIDGLSVPADIALIDGGGNMHTLFAVSRNFTAGNKSVAGYIAFAEAGTGNRVTAADSFDHAVAAGFAVS